MQKQTSTHGCQSESPEILQSDSRLTRMGFLQPFCFLILIVLLSLTACNSDLNNIEEKQMMVEDVESVGFSAMRPFEAWMLTPSMGTRSVDSEITEVIEYEKGRFDERFSFVEKFFKFVPVPQWESAKVVSYNEEEADVFILCNNDFEDNAILNKLVLVITIRGDDHFSFIKMLPKDEYLAVWATAVNDGENVHIEVHQREPDGIFVSQRVGYLAIDTINEVVGTRMIDCSYELIQNTQQYIMTYGDGGYGVINDVDEYVHFYCSDYGSSGGTYAPPPAAGGGSIPGYTPPSFPSSGSSGGSTSGGDSGGSSYTGGSSNYGGSGSVGGGDNSGGGSVGGGGSSSGNSTPTFPEGGLDLIPRPEYVEELPDEMHPLISSHSLSTPQFELLIQAFNDLQDEGCMQKALYDALIARNVKLNFGMKTNTAPGGYNPKTGELLFSDNTSITSAVLKEELFHAWQNAYYSGGIAQYLNVGKVNIEFEAKLYQDIIEGEDASCCLAFRGDHIPVEIRNNYFFWIESVRFKPDRSFSDSDYTKWLALFDQYDPEYGSATSINLLLPLALRDLIGSSNCF